MYNMYNQQILLFNFNSIISKITGIDWDIHCKISWLFYIAVIKKVHLTLLMW